MTLTITYVSPRHVFQSGDFRLINPKTGEALDYWAQKQVIVHRYDWTALVAFCGAAHTGTEFVPEWLRTQVTALPDDASFDDLIQTIAGAEDWLPRLRARYRHLTFSVAGFTNFKPIFVLISNFEELGKPLRPLPAAPPATLAITTFRPKSGRLFFSGQTQFVTRDDRLRILAAVRNSASPELTFDAMAAVNAAAAKRDPGNAVSEGCFVSNATIVGRCEGHAYGWPDDRSFRPALIDGFDLHDHLPTLLADHFPPGAIVSPSITAVSFPASAEHFRVALREKPHDAELLNNYGSWLAGEGKTEEAEEAFENALREDSQYAHAHHNIAKLRHEGGNRSSAIEGYRRAVELDDKPRHIVSLALALSESESPDELAEANTLFQRAIGMERSAFTLGPFALFAAFKLKDQEHAATLFEEALLLTPLDLWTNRAFAKFLWEIGGDVAAARRHFDCAVGVDDPDLDALLEYGALELQHGERIEAGRGLIERAVRIKPTSASALALLAAAKFLAGESDSTVEAAYRQALEEDPRQPMASVNLAQLLLLRGSPANRDEARSLLEGVIDSGCASDLQIESLFYGFAHEVPGFNDAEDRIRELLDAGARIIGWDLSRNVEAARVNGHADATAVARIAAQLSSPVG